MKVLDPQSALLTTAEVFQFLKDSPVREVDKKVGSYATVNIANNHVVRRDVEHYIQLVQPQVTSCPPVESFMRPLLQSLKEYELTKTEVLTLVNLGVGLESTTSPATNGHAESEASGSADAAAQDEEDDPPQESDLSKSLFRLVVEESDERFAGDEGEQQIDEILAIINDALRAKSQPNGHKAESTID